MTNNAQPGGASAGGAGEDSIQWLDTDDKDAPAAEDGDDDSVQCLDDVPAKKGPGSTQDALPMVKGSASTQDALPVETGWGSTQGPLPVTTGWGSTQGPLPVTTGWGSAQDALPVVTGWGSTQDSLPVATGWGSTQGALPVVKGSASTQSALPVTSGWGSTQGALLAVKGSASAQDALPVVTGWGSTQDALPVATGSASAQGALPMTTGSVSAQGALPVVKGSTSTQGALPMTTGWRSTQDWDEPASVEGAKKLRREEVEEDEIDLIDLEWEPTDQIVEIDDDESSCEELISPELQVIDEKHRETHKPDYNRLPVKAICYDYSTQPMEVTEMPRKFYAELNHACPPFRRPILVDGIGFIYAFIRCSATQPYRFPLVPILRCLYYWISRGHVTTLVFPRDCNPLIDDSFVTTDADKAVLKKLQANEMLLFFDPIEGTTSAHEWYKRRMVRTHACLVVAVNHWISNTMLSFDPTKASCNGGGRHSVDKDERLLQPFMINDGLIVFFSSASSTGRHVSQMVVIKDVRSWTDYEEFDKLQLNFIDQAKQLKVLHEELPVDLRFRETGVMVEIIKRLAPFLPGGEATR